MVDRPPPDRSKVYFGAWVTLEDEAGEELVYRIVGPDEFDLKQRKLSMDSPMAKALLGKRLNDDVLVNTPEGRREYYIVAIRYENAG